MNGTEYEVEVEVYYGTLTDKSCIGSRGKASTKVTLPDVPDAPSAPTLTVGNTQLVVEWTAPDHNRSAITDYDLQYCSAGCGTAANWTFVENGTPTTTPSTIAGLTNSTAYQVQVRATNSIGDSSWSASATETPAAVPDAPDASTLRAENVEEEQFNISWTAPANNGSAITEHDVRYSSTNGSSWTELHGATTGTSTTVTIQNLTASTDYVVQVRAVNAHGNGLWSDSLTASTIGTQQPNSQQPTAAAVEVPYEIVLRGAVERVSNPGAPEPLSLYFPTRSLSDCDDREDEAEPDCASLTFPDGVYEGLDEAVSETVRKNIWGSYVVTDEVGTAREWQRRFRAWLDTERLGFALEGRRYFALQGRAIFDLDLWIIYYMAERGMNSVRLAERPFDPMLTVCLPRPRSAGADAIVAVWDYQEWRWQPLESVVSEDEGQICALTPFVTEFSLVAAESVSELGWIP